jgi:anti-sigma-K factor RskA
VADNVEHVMDELAAYVLGSLDDSERRHVEAHVETCPTCSHRLEAYRAIVGVLPAALPSVQPPVAAWTAIRAAAMKRRGPVTQWVRSAALPAWIRAVKWPALATAAAALLAWNLALEWRLAHPPYGPEVEALSRRPGRMVIFNGTGVPSANARLFVAIDGGHGHLAVSGLQPLQAGRTYQLWFFRRSAPAASGATFNVDARGRAWVKVTVPAPFNDTHAIAVTEETAPGSPAAPTGPHLLDAQPWR